PIDGLRRLRTVTKYVGYFLGFGEELSKGQTAAEMKQERHVAIRILKPTNEEYVASPPAGPPGPVAGAPLAAGGKNDGHQSPPGATGPARARRRHRQRVLDRLRLCPRLP